MGFVDRTLFIVRHGLCIRKARILCNGDIWGEDMVLSNVHLRERYGVRSVNYLEVNSLSFTDLDQMMLCFPHQRQRFRRTQIRMAIRAAFLKIAQAVKQIESDRNVGLFGL